MPEPLILKVLIVDDHFAARQLVANVMRDLGVTSIHMSSNGSEARDLVFEAHHAGQPFDVVFLDWDMPLIEGIDLLKLFRADQAFANTAFIMLTAAAEQKEVLEAAKAGASSYIIKPVSKAAISKKFLETLEWLKKQRAGKLGAGLKK